MTAAVTGSMAGPMIADFAASMGPIRTPFSREDEPLGRALAAAWAAGDWSETFEFAAMALAARYDIDTPFEWAEFEAPPPRLAWVDKGRVFVRAPHGDDYTNEADRFDGRTWHGEPELRAWSFRPSMKLWDWLEHWKIMPSEGVDLACRRRAVSPPASMTKPLDFKAAAKAPPPPNPPTTVVESQPDIWEVTCGPYGLDQLNWVKAVPGHAQQIGKDGHWFMALDDGADPYEWVVAGVRLEIRGLEKWLAELEMARRPKAYAGPVCDASRALAPSPGFVMRPGLTMDLPPHQLACVEYVTELATIPNRALIGDDMGLGKGIEAVACVHQAQAYPALIVCPASITINWSHEIRKLLPDASVDVCTTRSGAPGVAQFTIIGYEALQKRLSAFERTPWGSVVIDEAHYIKNPHTNRGIATKMVAEGVRGMRLAMTGTFIKNKDKDALFPLTVIGREDVAQLVRDDKENQSVILRAHCMVRRKKLDVMPDLPPLQVVKTYVEPDPEVWKEYLKAEADLIAYVKEQARKIAEKLGLDPATEEVKAEMRTRGAEVLVSIGILRKLAAQAKMKSAIESVKRFFEQTDQSIIVFAHHRDIIEAMGHALKCDIIMGGASIAERQQVVEDFQAKKKRAVVIGFMAGGVGLTLTAATEMKLLELQWTPADMDQAYSRAWGRWNDAHGLIADHLLIEGSIDEMFLDIIEEKRVIAGQALDGDSRDAIMSSSIIGDVINRLAERPES